MRRLVFLLLVLLPVLAGCSRMSVGHMQMNPWVMGQQQEVALKYWRFEYRTEPRTNGVDGYLVTGRAYPAKDALPGWADWIDDLWLGAYVADADGEVLARDRRTYLPGPLALEKGLPFSFEMDPADGERPLRITFGYRMTLADGPPDEAGAEVEDRRLFFGSETALSSY
jgi:hypothetical protein